MALNLLILPIVVFRPGVAAFGVASLVTACVAPALAFSNALALSTTRELAQRLAPSERDEARRLFATATMLAIGAGGLIVIVLSLAGGRHSHVWDSISMARPLTILDLPSCWRLSDGCVSASPPLFWRY